MQLFKLNNQKTTKKGEIAKTLTISVNIPQNQKLYYNTPYDEQKYRSRAQIKSATNIYNVPANRLIQLSQDGNI